MNYQEMISHYKRNNKDWAEQDYMPEELEPSDLGYTQCASCKDYFEEGETEDDLCSECSYRLEKETKELWSF